MRPIVRPIFTNSADTSAQHEDANNFTLLRLLLAVMVVFGHFKLLTGSPQPFPFNLADAAVDCFFVVSGFLVTGSFERSRNLWAFYTRRVFRVWPMYAFVVVAQTVALVALLPRGIFSEIGETLRYLVANLLMANFLQNDIGGVLHKLVVPTINPSLWTLKIEMGFYLIIPAIYLAIRRWGWSVLVIIFATSALYDVVALKFGFDRYAKQLPGQMQFFVVGMALYLYGQRIRVSPIVAVSVSVAFLAAWTWFWPIPSGL
jgi:peptidoglycan/LPS O-acetylase OafA/YrhL